MFCLIKHCNMLIVDPLVKELILTPTYFGHFEHSGISVDELVQSIFTKISKSYEVLKEVNVSLLEFVKC